MYCKLGRKGCLTIDAALRPVLWTGLDITTILLQKQYKLHKLWSTRHLCTLHSHEHRVGVLEHTEQCGNETKVKQRLSRG